jgi:hypothetical protein
LLEQLVCWLVCYVVVQYVNSSSVLFLLLLLASL